MSLIPSRNSSRKSATKSKSLKIQIDNKPTDSNIIEVPDDGPEDKEFINYPDSANLNPDPEFRETLDILSAGCTGSGQEKENAEQVEETAESSQIPDTVVSPPPQVESPQAIEMVDQLELVAPDLPVDSPLPTTGLPSNYEGQLLPLHPPVIIEGSVNIELIQCA